MSGHCRDEKKTKIWSGGGGHCVLESLLTNYMNINLKTEVVH